MTTQYECYKLDTQTQVFFYEQDFYVLSNFSAFSIQRYGMRFDTAEHLYHWEKFNWVDGPEANLKAIRDAIRLAPSAHEAFKRAQDYKEFYDPEWESSHKIQTMLGILRDKVNQHEYVRRKLLQTGDRELIEDSWRDNYWGWGPNKDGQNMLGKLWMQVRSELQNTNS